MKEVHLFYAPDIAETHELPADETGHAVRVLRMKEGDELLATDGKGRFYNCRITLASPKHCAVEILSSTEGERLWQGSIRIAVAPTKNMDRMEWFAEKATEIGLDGIALLNCKNSERRIVKTERLEKTVISATKQSHKAMKPTIEDMTDFKKFIAQPHNGQKFIAHCHEGEKPFLADLLTPDGDALVLIGPEGDFSQEEVSAAIAAGFRPISLGKSRLRTETAALVAVHLMNLAKKI